MDTVIAVLNKQFSGATIFTSMELAKKSLELSYSRMKNNVTYEIADDDSYTKVLHKDCFGVESVVGYIVECPVWNMVTHL